MTELELFENWARTEMLDLSPNGNVKLYPGDTYADEGTELAWCAWRSRADIITNKAIYEEFGND